MRPFFRTTRDNEKGSTMRATILLVDDDAEIRESSGGTLSLRTLETGDTLQIFGGYTGANFSATIILRT